MKLCEELKERSKIKLDLAEKLNHFVQYEKEDLFTVLRREADKGSTYCIISDYVLAFPYLVNKNQFEDILTEEGLTYEYIENKDLGFIDCKVKWG